MNKSMENFGVELTQFLSGYGLTVTSPINIAPEGHQQIIEEPEFKNNHVGLKSYPINMNISVSADHFVNFTRPSR